MRKLLVANPVLFFALLLIVCLAAGSLPSHIVYSPSPSLRYSFFVKGWKASPEKIQKGNFVTFDQRDEEGNQIGFIKEVSCVDGELLTVRNDEYFCNSNEYLGRAVEKNSNGTPLKRVKFNGFNGKIPSGYIFVSGSHPRSFDSRYFGFIRRENVRQIAYPVF